MSSTSRTALGKNHDNLATSRPIRPAAAMPEDHQWSAGCAVDQPRSSRIGLPALSLTGLRPSGSTFSLRGSSPRALENGGVDVLDGGGSRGILVPSGSVWPIAWPPRRPAAGNGQAEAGGPVVAAAEGVDLRRPAELAAAENDRPVEQLALPGRRAGWQIIGVSSRLLVSVLFSAKRAGDYWCQSSFQRKEN